MIQYKVKEGSGVDTYLEIVKEYEDGFDVLIISVCDNYKKETTEYMSRKLLETCLRTGYLQKLDDLSAALISA